MGYIRARGPASAYFLLCYGHTHRHYVQPWVPRPRELSRTLFALAWRRPQRCALTQVGYDCGKVCRYYVEYIRTTYRHHTLRLQVSIFSSQLPNHHILSFRDTTLFFTSLHFTSILDKARLFIFLLRIRTRTQSPNRLISRSLPSVPFLA